MVRFRGLKKVLFDTLVIFVVIATIIFVYRVYWPEIRDFIFGEQPSTMYIRSVPVSVTIADEPHEQEQGLSGVRELGEFEGKLFVFNKEGYYSMWMKDMYIPIDIIWINNDLKVVHIEKNVTPKTYPKTFTSDEPARFVLEVNAFFVESERIQKGDDVIIPSSVLPYELIKVLQ